MVLYVVLYVVPGALIGVTIWQVIVWLGEIGSKKRKYEAACACAAKIGKPLLIAGGPWGNQRLRRLLRIPAHGQGDVCLDIDRNAVDRHPNGVIADVAHIPFRDRNFGAVFASHLLEHLSTVEEARHALDELSRTAKGVFIASPSRQSIAAWLHPGHHLWVSQNGRAVYLEQRGKGAPRQREEYSIKMPEADQVLCLDAERLAQRLFGNNTKMRNAFTSRLLETCEMAKDKDFLIIHNPGGWGSTPLDDLLVWERSIVDGVTATIERMGYRYALVQYFRSGNSFWAHIGDLKEQTRFAFRGQSTMARLMAAELDFVARHLKNVRILLVGVSQGAAFSNAVMRQIRGLPRVYSIELGIFFLHMSRRVLTDRTLAIDGNGVVPDPMTHRNLKVGLRAYVTAPARWIKFRMEGKPQKFSYCINAPGHDYNWEYPGVSRKIEDFLRANFGTKDKLEVVKR